MIPNPDENEDFTYHPSAFELDPDLWSDEKIVESDSSEEVIKLRNPNDDLISREDLKKEIENLVVGGEKGLKDYYERGTKADENSWIGGIYDAWELIKNAPTVTPEKALIDKLKGGAEK